jgi:hypothetical protein
MGQQQGDYGQSGQGQPWRPQQQDPRLRPAATPPQWQQQPPPSQDSARSRRPQYPQRKASQPSFTPGYPTQPSRGQYPPPQPAWQEPYQPPQYAPQPPRQRRPHTARNVIGGIAGLGVAIIVIAVAANSGHSVQTAGSTAGTGAQGSSTQKTAGIGSAITLAGNSSGEQMSVTVTKVISDAQPGDEFTSAPAGDRLYAVQFRLTDTGSAAYSDAPSNGAAVTDSTGQSYQSAIADTAAGCTSFPGSENIAPGSSGLGCIVFEVPTSAKITQVQFTLDSGMGPDTGQWDVG